MRHFFQTLRSFIQEETPYCLILSGAILFQAFSFLYLSLHASPAIPSGPKGHPPSAGQEFSVDPQKLQQLLAENPTLQVILGIFSFLLIGVFVGGIVLNVWFWTNRRMRRWRTPWHLFSPKPKWGLRDVFRVCVLLILMAYLVELVQLLFLIFWRPDLPEQVRLMVNTAVMDLMGLGLILWWISVHKSQPLRGLGLSVRHLGRNVLFGFSSYTALLPILAASLFLSLWVAERIRLEPPEQPLYDIFFKDSSPAVLGVAVLLVVLLGPLAEEVFFRGFLYNAVKSHLGKGWAILTSGALFALLHANWVGFLPITLLGVTLAYVYEATGTLVASVTLHVVHNALVMGLLFLMRDLLQRMAGG